MCRAVMASLGQASAAMAEELLKLRDENRINEGEYLSLVNMAQNMYNAATGRVQRENEGDSRVMIAADRIRQKSEPFVQLLLKQSCVDAITHAGSEDYGRFTFEELEEYLSKLAMRFAGERLGSVAMAAESSGSTVERAAMERMSADLGLAS